MKHGTRSGYKRHKCRCDECREWNRLEAIRWRAAQPETSRAIRRRWATAHPDRAWLNRTYAEKDKWRKANMERVRETSRAWKRANYARRRAAILAEVYRRRGVPYAPEALEWIASLVDPTCAYCGAPASTIDHVVPISRGGTGERSNLAPACLPCNSSKGAKLLSEWGGR